MLSLESLKDDPDLIRVVLNFFHRGLEKNQNQFLKKIKSVHDKLDIILNRIQVLLGPVFTELKQMLETYEKALTVKTQTKVSNTTRNKPSRKNVFDGLGDLDLTIR